MIQFEEYKMIRDRWSWAIIIAACAFMLLRGWLLQTHVQDPPRQHDYGVLPDTPGESVYSTSQPPPPQQAHPPRQIPPLPLVATSPAADGAATTEGPPPAPGSSAPPVEATRPAVEGRP